MIWIGHARQQCRILLHQSPLKQTVHANWVIHVHLSHLKQTVHANWVIHVHLSHLKQTVHANWVIHVYLSHLKQTVHANFILWLFNSVYNDFRQVSMHVDSTLMISVSKEVYDFMRSIFRPYLFCFTCQFRYLSNFHLYNLVTCCCFALLKMCIALKTILY